MYLLVVGGGGYLGREIVNQAIRLRWKVVSLSLNKKKINSINHKNVKHFFIDLTKKNKLLFLKKYKFDYVVNVSGYVDHRNFSKKNNNIIRNHLESLINLVSILNRSKLKRFLHVGSSDEYGVKNKLQYEDDREDPQTPYAFSKVAITHFLQMMNRSENYPITILRVFLVYGPGQDNNRLIPYTINNCLKDKKFKLSDGSQVRDFTYIDDVIGAIFACIKSKTANGNIYNVGTGKGYSVKYIVKLIQSIIGKGKPDFGKIKNIRKENQNLVAQTKKIKKDLKWCAKTKLVNGINITIKSYNEQD